MLHIGRWKLALVLLSVVFGVLFTLPNLLPKGAMPSWAPQQRLNLGLDLQGGSYLLLEVDTAALRRERLNNQVEDVRRTLREERIPFTNLAVAGGAVGVRITNPAQLDAAVRALGTLGTQQATGGTDLTVERLADQ